MIIYIYFLIPAAAAQICNPAAKSLTPVGILTNESKEETEKISSNNKKEKNAQINLNSYMYVYDFGSSKSRR